ncbi:MAG: TIGR00730 family Rossman fold protein [Anaerolineae bacterium]|nr:TIGR00730 family Rossman fold protein [Anaerolineae bacterium]
MNKAIAVFGSSRGQSGDDSYEQARILGHLLAQAGFDVVSGGYGGSMQGVSQGAAEGGGKAIGVTCATFGSPNGNSYLSQAIHSPDLPARLRQLIDLADGFVVLPGGIGTLAELFVVWNLIAVQAIDKPCVLLGAHWRRVLAVLERETYVEAAHAAMLHIVDTSVEAVRMLVACIQ